MPGWAVPVCIVGGIALCAGIVVDVTTNSVAATYLFAVSLLTILACVLYRFGVHHYRELRHNHRCPACLYDLRGIPAEPDGCTVCPECSSAWRLPATGA